MGGLTKHLFDIAGVLRNPDFLIDNGLMSFATNVPPQEEELMHEDDLADQAVQTVLFSPESVSGDGLGAQPPPVFCGACHRRRNA